MPENNGDKDAGAVARLTTGQRACLALVAEGCTSKEIAKRLAISPHTVDQRLRLAIQALGTASRFEAARLYRQSADRDARPIPPQYQAADSPAYQTDKSPYQSAGDTADRPPEQYQRPVYQAPDIAAATAEAIPNGVSDEADDIGEHGRPKHRRSVFGEARTAFRPLAADRPVPPASADATRGGRRNDLSPAARMGWTMGLVIGLILALSLLVTMAEGLVRIMMLGGR